MRQWSTQTEESVIKRMRWIRGECDVSSTGDCTPEGARSDSRYGAEAYLCAIADSTAARASTSPKP